MPIVVYKIIFIVTAFTAGAVAVDVFLKRTVQTNFARVFGFMSVAFVIWAGGRFGLLTATDQAEGLFWAHFLYIGSILVHLFFLHTIIVFLNVENRPVNKVVLAFFYLLAVVLLTANIIYFFTGDSYLVEDVVPKMSFAFYEEPGKLYNLHLINYLFIPAYALYLLLREFANSKDDKRKQIKLVLFSSVLGFVGGNSVVPLVYNVPLEPIPLVLVPLYLVTLTYAIARYRLFNIKVVTTELFTFALWVFILTRVFVSDNVQEQIINTTLLGLTIIVGVFLIRSVIREVSLRERVEKLSEEKSEFMSFASHQVKGPLTNVKVATSMLLAGDFGPLPDQIKEIVKGLYDTAEKAIPMVQNFLDISKLEQSGGMQFDKKPIDIRQVAEEVMSGQKITAEAKGLGLEFSVSPEGNFTVNADPTKIKEVIFNLIDNAIKYTPRGKVEVTLRADGQNKKVLLSVRDSGVGLTADDLVRLFTKFGRGKDAKRVNTHSSGLGLYLARQIVDAHGGRIWAESEGSGSGSVFTVELPTDR